MSLITQNSKPDASLSSPVEGRNQTTPAPAFRPDLVRGIRMRPRLALGVALAVMAIIIGYALTIRPSYMAESLVYVEPASAKMLSDGSDSAFDPGKYDSYLQQQMITVTRPDILTRAIQSLPAGTWQGAGETAQSAADRLATRLKIERVTSSYQLSISLKGDDPKRIAAVVNAVTSAYLEAGRKDEVSRSDVRVQILSEERHRLDTELEHDRTEQAVLGGKLGVASPVGDTGNPYDVQLVGVRAQLEAAREAHDVAAAQLASMSGTDATHTSGLSAAADELIAQDTGLVSMKSSVNERRAVLDSQMAGLTPSNPVYKADQQEIADLDRSLSRMTSQLRDQAAQRLQDKLRSDLQRTGDIESRLNGQLARQTATATSAAPRLQRASELAAEIARLTARYAVVDDSLRGLQLEASGPGMAHLSLAATAPLKPEASKRRMFLLAALPLGLLFGALTASLFQRRDPVVYGGRDLEEVLGFSPIAVLPAREDVSAVVLSEYILRLAAGVETAYRTNGARSFLFTPASARTRIVPLLDSLSSMLQQLGLDVITVPASDMLSTVSGATQPAGSQPGFVPEGLVPSNIRRALTGHDLVFIDAPALLSSAETEYVARCADITVMVAESGITLKQELLQAASLLARLKVTGIAAVLEELHLRYAEPAFVEVIKALELKPQRTPLLLAGQPAISKRFAQAPAISLRALDRSFSQAVEPEPESPEMEPENMAEILAGVQAEFQAEFQGESQAEAHAESQAAPPAAQAKAQPEPAAAAPALFPKADLAAPVTAGSNLVRSLAEIQSGHQKLIDRLQSAPVSKSHRAAVEPESVQPAHASRAERQAPAPAVPETQAQPAEPAPIASANLEQALRLINSIPVPEMPALSPASAFSADPKLSMMPSEPAPRPLSFPELAALTSPIQATSTQATPTQVTPAPSDAPFSEETTEANPVDETDPALAADASPAPEVAEFEREAAALARWERIPPLRPGTVGWRDRSNPDNGRRPSGPERRANWNREPAPSATPAASVPATPAFIHQSTPRPSATPAPAAVPAQEPARVARDSRTRDSRTRESRPAVERSAGEPILTRSWGLLSQFDPNQPVGTLATSAGKTAERKAVTDAVAPLHVHSRG